MTRIAFTSDLHVDLNPPHVFEAFKLFLAENKVDVLSFAGDLSGNIVETTRLLQELQKDLQIKVCAVTGNHEMRDTQFGNSFDSLQYFRQTAPDISLEVTPYEFKDYVILGHMSWYDYSTRSVYFNDYEQHNMTYQGDINKDLYCDWNGLIPTHVADYFLEDLKYQLKKYQHKKIILVTHIVPFREYILEKNDKSWDYWNAYMGNVCIGHLAETYGVKVCHFGHTHMRFTDTRNQNMHIICSPLGYTKEWTSPFQDIQYELSKAVQILDF